MASSALAEWRTVRSERLDELLSVHTKVGGVRPGRRYGTAQLNRALIVALVGEFQGFARGLHDEVASAIVDSIPQQNLSLQVARLLRTSRNLDSGNPRPGALGNDFGMFGMTFVPSIKAAVPWGAAVLETLENLVELRSGIAHADDTKIANLEAMGYAATRTHFKRYRSSLDRLAGVMDKVTSSAVASLCGRPPPW